MKSNKVTLFVLNIVCITSLLTVMGFNKNTTPIRIGVTGTMSGINSDLSVSGRRGVELAVNEFNKAGGYKGRSIELIVKDDKNDATTALNIDKEFISEKIPIVIGHYTSGMMVNSMNYLRNKDILFLSPTISADALSGIDDNFIRFISTSKEQAIVIAKAANKNKNKKFAVVHDLKNKGFCEALYSSFKKLLENNKGEIVLSKAFTSGADENYVSIAKSIIDSKTEAVLIIANSADNAAITQQIRKLGSKVQIYSPLWSNTADLMKKAGAAAEGMFIVGAIDLNDRNAAFIKFKEDYIDTYGENPTFSSMYSYEAATALFKAIKMGPDLKPNTIKNNIIKIKNFRGLEGNYRIDKYGDNIRKYMIFELKNGEFRKVD